jgi:hypothetical protein
MIRNKTTSSLKQTEKEKLVLVRYSLLYGISIERAKPETLSLKRGIVATPTFLFHTNNTKCLIDYSNQTNSDAEKATKEFFDQITTGTTLTITNGYYKDPNFDFSADVSGTYVYRSYFNGVIETDVTSVESLYSGITKYNKLNFEQIPYLSVPSLKTPDENRTLIKNKLGKNTKNSFNYLGIKVGDYIRISSITVPLKVLKLEVDSEGNEFIEIQGVLEEVDYTNQKIKIEVYVSVLDKYTTTPNAEERDVGACIEYSGGVIVSCTNNHTLSQCRARSSTVRGVTTELTLGTFCSTPETDTAIQTTTTDNLVQITNTLADAVVNINNTISRTKFYGRNF